MPVYVDRARNAFGRIMIADTLVELHAMADRVGLQRRWFQVNASFPHYDVSQSVKTLALMGGALEVDRTTLAQHMKRLRADPAFIAEWRAARGN